ncbi:LysE family translocator [Devosia sp.]|uniref:LysE family translocator n=1 Tax=Devosia sp. TaxID=1871048 RepID=UPI001ACB6A88|nr:LysE family translocator [Devosia sp.]MBN9332902.1 LysE family translocator [Devosia sp.]
MEASALITFWSISLLFVVTPGADWAYAISAGLKDNAAVPAVSGLLAGHLVATLVVAAGVGVLIVGIPHALTVLTIIGALYLMWLGIGMVMHPAQVAAGDDSAQNSWQSWAARGFGVSGLNPKVFLLFLAVLPQFSNLNAAWPVSVQLALLGLLHVVNCAVVYAAVAGGANLVLRSRPNAARVVGRVSGIIMLLVSLVLIFEQFR